MNDKQREWLQTVLAVVTFILLWMFYYVFQDVKAPFSFLIDMIPDLKAGLFVVIIIYFVFKRQGIVDKDKAKILEERTNTIIQNLGSLQRQVNGITEDIGCIEKFHESFYDFDWKDLIESAEQEIDIVVYYFDSWLKQNQDLLESFFKKPNTKLRIILSDPDQNIDTIKRLFSNPNENSLREKINNTKTRASSILNKAGANPSRLEVYLYPHHLSYAIQFFDKTRVVLSVFEMFREDRVQSPVFLLDLTKSEKIKHFINKEIDGLIKESKLFK